MTARKTGQKDYVIRVDDLWKRYRRYHEKYQTLKDVVLKFGRASYDEFWALSGVSFEVEPGTALGIIGENGSGKSTLLKVLARILKPSMGTVEMNGRVSALLELGAGFHPDLTGAENVYLNASVLGLSKRLVDKRFDQIVEFAELKDFIDTPVRNYSSGMYARLGFSVAVNVDPDILLVDEVLAVGDVFFQRKCLDKMDEFKAAGKTIVLVSHSLDQIKNVCDRAIFMHQGKIESIGKTEKVLNDYLTYIQSEKGGVLPTGQALHPGGRCGTGEIVIDSVRITDSAGEEIPVFQMSDQVTVEINYEQQKKVENPVFGVSIYRDDGAYCYGVNTKIDDFEIKDRGETGRVCLTYDALNLLPGNYLLSVAIFDSQALHTYDFHERMYKLTIASSREGELGVAFFPHHWKTDRISPAE